MSQNIPAPCGTYGAYQQHKLRGEQACSRCLEANRQYKNAHQRRYEQKEQNRQKRIERWMKSRHKLTPSKLAEMISSQGGGCAICGATEPGGKGHWHIDHDHSCCPGRASCGKCLRGALCARCNMALGLFHDNIAHLNSAILYLRAHATENLITTNSGD